MAQMIEHLPSKHETLNLNLSTTKKRGEREKGKGGERLRDSDDFLWQGILGSYLNQQTGHGKNRQKNRAEN
jgi:hypothetical protein